MILACACGGVFETLFFVMTGVLAWIALKFKR